jgi:DNA repair protein RadC
MKIQRYEIALKKVGRVSEQFDPICSAPEASKHLSPLCAASDREVFCILLLDTRNRPLGNHIVSVGNLNGSMVHPREVFKVAILANCCSIILCHNHPSGELTPSADDRAITERLVKAGSILGIEVLDHVILYGTEYYSFKENGIF